MPRFARLFDAAADTLNAYYQAIAESNLESVMNLWIDEELVSCISASGAHMHGLEHIRTGLAQQFETRRMSIEPLDIRVYDSLGTVVYAVAEMHRSANVPERADMVFTTYVMVHERGAWRIAHIHASPMPEATAKQFAVNMRHGQGPLH
jgi:uncharacterized protein (TIGR02246 family)